MVEGLEVGQPNPEMNETPESDQIIYFENMTDEQRNELKVKIGQNDGLIRVWVHPFYETYLREMYFSNETEKEKKEREEFPPSPYEIEANKIGEEVKKFCVNPGDGPVNFVFEEFTHVDETARRMQKAISETDSKNKIYLIKTRIDDPTPKLSVRDNRNEGDAWIDTLTDLDELGVKKIIVGGQLFSIIDHNPDQFRNMSFSYRTFSKIRVGQRLARNEVYIDNCVSYAMNAFATFFNVELSSVVFPDSRVDFRNAEMKKK
jgi:hypothetical protein